MSPVKLFKLLWSHYSQPTPEMTSFVDDSSAPSLLHHIKHWCTCKGWLEPVYNFGLASAYRKSLLWLQPVSYQLLSLLMQFDNICLLLLWLFECGHTGLPAGSELTIRRHIKSLEMRVIRVCCCCCLWPLAQQWDMPSWKWHCECVFDSCICITTYVAVHLWYALWFLPHSTAIWKEVVEDMRWQCFPS